MFNARLSSNVIAENSERPITYTGYGTDGIGNVETGYAQQEGTGYDEDGQVITKFGKWQVEYDPVTGKHAFR